MHRVRDIATYWSKIAEKATTLICPANPRKYLHKLCLVIETSIFGLYFSPMIVWIYLIYIFVVGSRRYMCNVKKRIMAVQRFKVNSGSSKNFGTNRKRACDFLLVFNSNYGRILHCFGNTVAYRSKNRQNRSLYPPHKSHKSPSLGVTS